MQFQFGIFPTQIGISRWPNEKDPEHDSVTLRFVDKRGDIVLAHINLRQAEWLTKGGLPDEGEVRAHALQTD